MLNESDLLSALKARAKFLGLTVEDESRDGFKGEQESILVKWLLGQRKVAYKMSLRLSEGDHTANFREMVKEQSWGLLPPTLHVETTGIKGWERSGTVTEKSPAGGGKVDYARVREELKKTVTGAGWQFHLEGGRAP
jgi:hypothetical protein